MTSLAWLIIAVIVLPLAYFTWVLVTLDRKGALAVQTNLGTGLVRGGSSDVQRTSLLLGVSKRVTPEVMKRNLTIGLQWRDAPSPCHSRN